MNEDEKELILAQDKAQDKAQDEIVNEKISNMNEEEKEAIEKLDYELTYSWVHNQGISKETLKLFKDIIEKQQKEIENLKEKLKYERSFSSSALEALKEGVHKDEIRHIRDKAECMDYYSLNDVIDDLSKLLGENKDE